jgi:hypothetical protein
MNMLAIEARFNILIANTKRDMALANGRNTRLKEAITERQRILDDRGLHITERKNRLDEMEATARGRLIAEGNRILDEKDTFARQPKTTVVTRSTLTKMQELDSRYAEYVACLTQMESLVATAKEIVASLEVQNSALRADLALQKAEVAKTDVLLQEWARKYTELNYMRHALLLNREPNHLHRALMGPALAGIPFVPAFVLVRESLEQLVERDGTIDPLCKRRRLSPPS